MCGQNGSGLYVCGFIVVMFVLMQLSESLDLPSIRAVRPCELHLCSATKDAKHIRDCFESFIDEHLSSCQTQSAQTVVV